MASAKDLALNNLKMEINMRESGTKIRRTVREGIGMLMAIITKAIGKITKPMEWAYTLPLMDQVILVNGKMIYSTVMAERLGLIVQPMRVTTEMAQNMVVENTSMLMAQFMMDNGRIIKSMELALIIGKTINHILVNGKKEICLDKEHSVGPMVANTKVNIC